MLGPDHACHSSSFCIAAPQESDQHQTCQSAKIKSTHNSIYIWMACALIKLGVAFQEGLKVLQEDGLVFKCYETLHDTVWNSELGSSVAIFNAGYTIDSLLLKYQGADWRDKGNWNCNAG